MQSIKNKKYWIGHYIVLTICVLIIPVILTPILNHDLPKQSTILLTAMIVLYLIFIFFMFKKLLFSYKLNMSNEGILFISKHDREQIKWDDILDIQYFEKTDFFRLPSIKIDLKSSKKSVFINHSHYSNSNILTQAIKYCYDSINQRKTVDLNSFVPIKIDSVSNIQTRFEKMDYISPSPLTTLRSYLPFFGFFGIYKIVTTDFIPLVGIISILIISALSMLVGVIGIGKLGFSDKYLTIENFYLPIQKTYRLADIKKVFIENLGVNTPNQIRIITNDYGQKSFRLANFVKKDWKQLEKILTEKNIDIDNRL